MKNSLIIATALLCLIMIFGNAIADEGFRTGQVYESESLGTVHYNLYVPADYDGSRPYALHIAMPGWEGLWFQGLEADLRWEYLPHESNKYVSDMIVVSTQLNDWNYNGASQAIALTEYIMNEYNIDPERVYITGYSVGGETLSRVLELKPELYTAALFVSSQWDGDPQPLVNARLPLYLFTAEHDSYYGADPARRAWQNIHDLYINAGLSEEEISEILVLDIRPDNWFDETMAADPERTGTMYATDYHGTGMLVAFDEAVMSWVFGHGNTAQKTADAYVRMTFADGTVGEIRDLRDNSTTRAFLDSLPSQITMNDWDGREYWYSGTLPYDQESVQHTYAVGEFTYWCGGWVTAYYNTNDDTVIEAGSVVIGTMDDTSVRHFQNAHGTPQTITFEYIRASE